MADPTICFLDANVLAAPATRTLVVVGARQDGLVAIWSAHAEAEADTHARPGAKPTSEVRQTFLGMELSPSASFTTGLATTSPADRQILSDAIAAGARFLITVDVDDFAIEDLRTHRMSAVNPDYFMALRFTENAYRAGVAVLSFGMNNPARTEADVHQLLGRRHPHLTERFRDVYARTPMDPDPDQPRVMFRGVSCIHCGEPLGTDREQLTGIRSSHGKRGSDSADSSSAERSDRSG